MRRLQLPDAPADPTWWRHVTPVRLVDTPAFAEPPASLLLLQIAIPRRQFVAQHVAPQVLRIPALVAVLMLMGSALRTFQRSLLHGEAATAGWSWVVIAAAVLVFVAVALLGRATRHPPAVLVVEAGFAGLLGLVPPTVWLIWLGVSGLPRVFGIVHGSVVVPVLALAWLAIVVTTGVRQRRGRAARVRDLPSTAHDRSSG